jgi:hypothetical protein
LKRSIVFIIGRHGEKELEEVYPGADPKVSLA